jgi:hypothetical protein
MLPLLHDVLRQLLHGPGGIPAEAVDIRFEAPTREWVAARVQPTLNLYLFEVSENTDLRQSGMQTTRANGHAVHRMPPRRYDLRFMVSALSNVIEDEHLLLWRALATLLRYPQLPEEVLPEEWRSLETPLATKLDTKDITIRPTDLWSGLGAAPRPTLLYTVTVPVDPGVAIEAPLVLTRTTRYVRMAGQSSEEIGIIIGGTVRDKKGAPVPGTKVYSAGSKGAESVEGRTGESVSDAAGRWVLAGLAEGAASLQVEPPTGKTRTVTVEIPSASYDITLD